MEHQYKVKIICPLHGPILKENLGYYIEKYNIWSSYIPEEDGIFIAYASIYGNTRQAVEYIANILEEKGAKKVVLADLTRDDMSKAIENAFRYNKVIFAASSYNAGVFPPMQELLHALQSKNYQNRKIGIIENGSWAPSAGKCMKNILEQMKDLKICDPLVTIKSRMNDTSKKELENLANVILEK